VRRALLALVLAAALAVAAVPGAQAAPAPSQPRYDVLQRTNVPVVMSDGTTLRANVTVPADPETGRAAQGRFPVVLTETAYGKDLARSASGFSELLGNPDYYAKRGYVAVLVDVRGTGGSEGMWSFNDPQEARDSVEVIRWAAKLPESNGKVGMVGASYLGITQLFAAAEIGRGSPLKAIFPMVASNSIFREAVMPGGLLDAEGVGFYLGLTGLLKTANPVLAALSGGNAGDAAQPLVDHTAGLLSFNVGASVDALTGEPRAEDGAFWRARGPERVLARIARNRIPAFLVGGQDDLFQSGVYRNYVDRADGPRPADHAALPGADRAVVPRRDRVRRAGPQRARAALVRPLAEGRAQRRRQDADAAADPRARPHAPRPHALAGARGARQAVRAQRRRDADDRDAAAGRGRARVHRALAARASARPSSGRWASARR
jgi:hypothetical protein